MLFYPCHIVVAQFFMLNRAQLRRARSQLRTVRKHVSHAVCMQPSSCSVAADARSMTEVRPVAATKRTFRSISMPNCIICGGAWCIRSCCPLLISHYLTPVQCKSIQVSVEFPISRVNVILPLHFALLRAFVNPRQPRLSSPSPRAPETACAATST